MTWERVRRWSSFQDTICRRCLLKVNILFLLALFLKERKLVLEPDGIGYQTANGLADPVDHVWVVESAFMVLGNVLNERAWEGLHEALPGGRSERDSARGEKTGCDSDDRFHCGEDAL